MQEVKKAFAPFDSDQVKAINNYQKYGSFHPLTCGNNSHHRLLVATPEYLKCPDCDYVQRWVPIWIAQWKKQ